MLHARAIIISRSVVSLGRTNVTTQQSAICWGRMRQRTQKKPRILSSKLSLLSLYSHPHSWHFRVSNRMVTGKTFFVKTLLTDLPSCQFHHGHKLALVFPQWIVRSSFDVHIQRIYCGKRAWSASKCNLSVFPSVVCLSIHLRQGNVPDIYCSAFWWRWFLLCSGILP